jgi:phosphoribosylamine---glycine ligase
MPSTASPSSEFGDAGNQLVIEERLDGQEASVLAITDGARS